MTTQSTANDLCELDDSLSLMLLSGVTKWGTMRGSDTDFVDIVTGMAERFRPKTIPDSLAFPFPPHLMKLFKYMLLVFYDVVSLLILLLRSKISFVALLVCFLSVSYSWICVSTQ